MNPYFTLYTPTYNRAHLLHRVYASLLAQDGRDFEWLVIDDGSTDDTAARVAAWAAEAPFSVRYVRQANQGKHMATNRAVALAHGEMFVIVDSDDWLAEGALRAIRAAWESIPEGDRGRFANVAGLFLDPSGKPVTRLFPGDVFDCSSVEMEMQHGVVGEIAMATRTEVRRRFPFPENVGRYCMPSLVWNRIAVHYLTRYLNQPLQYKEYQEQGITLSGVHRKIRQSPEAFRLRSRELLELPLPVPPAQRVRAMRMYVRASLHAGLGFVDQWREIGQRALWLSQFAKGWRDYRRDCKKLAAA
jgi:glycosyltransferase involved in cell wall biosynthesis